MYMYICKWKNISPLIYSLYISPLIYSLYISLYISSYILIYNFVFCIVFGIFEGIAGKMRTNISQKLRYFQLCRL